MGVIEVNVLALVALGIAAVYAMFDPRDPS
jgi:hypothetical protein